MSDYVEVAMNDRATQALISIALVAHGGKVQNAVLQLTTAIVYLLNDKELTEENRAIGQQQVVQLVSMSRLSSGARTITMDEHSNPTIVPETRQ